ncbi:hypothetical protein DL93DRAFT_1204545 [Clavulina sp. PMI_390]|nr:hypothetical protein DL93DRAFT_1204545 [Clavulina sp. PMI_390]
MLRLLVRRSSVFALLSFFTLLRGISASDDWNCAASLGGHNYDFSSLGGQRDIERERETPPTIMRDRLTLNLCTPVTESTEGADGDKCPADTYACWRTWNLRGGENDRVVTVIPMATKSGLSPTVEQLSAGKISIHLHGGVYPPDGGRSQSLTVNLECSQEDQNPILESHDDAGAIVSWKTKTACHTANDPAGPPSSGGSKKGSGVSWFFSMLLLAFVAYFGIGAWYNYNNYGASGWDLLPHRDFWRDVPHLIQDVVSHLFTSVRSSQRTSRGGYVSV